VGFEPTVPASERAKTMHYLDRSSAVTGHLEHNTAVIFRVTFEPCYTLNTETVFLSETLLSTYQTHDSEDHGLYLMVFIHPFRAFISRPSFVGCSCCGVHLSIKLLMELFYWTSITWCSYIGHSFHCVYLFIIHNMMLLYRTFIWWCSFIEHASRRLHISNIHLTKALQHRSPCMARNLVLPYFEPSS
jgi:hypothetical protein